MFYHSTRAKSELVTSKQAIISGIAPDGGLFISDELFSRPLDMQAALTWSFKDAAYEVLSRLLDDYSDSELAAAIEAAYGDQWDDKNITPVSDLGTFKLLELYHGPTCAFKDVALQILPHLMKYARTDDTNIMVVTATSGDTGKAALEGFANVEGAGVCVFYPHGKVSDIQRLQMVTQLGDNVAVAAIEGIFDDCQSAVKALFADEATKAHLAENNIRLSSANSINIGRLAPQVSYYIYAYAELVRTGAIHLGDKVDFCVPTGNFGDILAGYFAKHLGVPIEKLIVASNENNVLTDFFQTGTYDRKREFHTTISPSMDILISSNLERLLYLESDGDTELVSKLMQDLRDVGAYTIDDALLARLRATFEAAYATDQETKATIEKTWQETGRLIDPHTAVAVTVAGHLRENSDSTRTMVILSTASPYKFSADVLRALEVDCSGMNGFACMDALEHLSKTEAPKQLSSLRAARELHKAVCGPDKIAQFVSGASARIFL